MLSTSGHLLLLILATGQSSIIFDSSITMFEQFQRLAMEAKNPETSEIADGPTNTFYEHSTGIRINTDTIIAAAIRRANPGLRLTIVPKYSVNLFQWAAVTGAATVEPLIDESDRLTEPLSWRVYLPSRRRLDSSRGGIADDLKFGKFSYTYQGQQYIIYIVDGRDGASSYPVVGNQYILHADDDKARADIDNLIRTAGLWLNSLHDEIWVFDQGFWQKNADLWQSINRSRWEDVILESSEKDGLRKDVKRFYDSKERYERYRIAWKRGVIYYGPPGNGKTVSIKALSHELYQREDPIPTLYVKSFSGFGGPEASIKSIFAKARAEAPCLLIFEDLDSLVTDQVRSYFLNEIDGISPNNGIYIIGSTNHMDRLDPGISKRPSRFDRKFEFPKPNLEQRTMYCEYWRNKLKANRELDAKDTSDDDDATSMVFIDADDEINFPKELSPEIAKITDGFSFAYLQEAFVATLLILVARNDDDEDSSQDQGKVSNDKKDKFDDLLFWRIIKKQVQILRDQI